VRASTPQKRGSKAKGGNLGREFADEAQSEGAALSFPRCLPFCVFFVFFERERKDWAAMLPLGDAVGDTSEADEQRFVEEPLARAES